jgi:hypothetical protein
VVRHPGAIIPRTAMPASLALPARLQKVHT